MNINELHTYAVQIRRQLHMYPEVGFELPKTMDLVTSELEKMGITYSLEYGKCSVVADLGKGDVCVGLRADMDALPVQEKTDLPFASKIKGQMHACGHDAHTAIMLAVAKYLKENESSLRCKVRLIFQPSEEGAVSGAKMMVDNGVMDGVDEIICTHCEPMLEAGNIGLHVGDYMAACVPGTIRFHGKTAHATLAEYGIDALAMGVEAYVALKEMVAKEAGNSKYIWCNGKMISGFVHNVVPDECEMDISFRFYDMEFASRVETQVRKICNEIAQRHGGTVDFVWNMSTGPVCNDAQICDRIKSLPQFKDRITDVPQKLSSEDFGWYLTKKPGLLFRFGSGNSKKGWTNPAHCNNFYLDEDGMRDAIELFISYVKNR